MNVQFRFKSKDLAVAAQNQLPVCCDSKLVFDRTSDVYLEVNEEWEDFVDEFIYIPYHNQC